MDNASRYPNRVSTTATMARASIYISANESHQEKYVKVKWRSVDEQNEYTAICERMKTYIYVLESDPNIDNARRYPKNPRRESDRVFVQAH